MNENSNLNGLKINSTTSAQASGPHVVCEHGFHVSQAHQRTSLLIAKATPAAKQV
tara:strand:- start:568 stop:732 length:165 start_codon:yes stop_codon:yes gene_type:complete